MQHAAEIYNHTAKSTRNPRDLEASLLIRAASRFQIIKDNWEEDKAGLEEALLFNRKLWTVFVTSATATENPLPQEIKNNIGSLAAFIFQQSLSIQAKPAPEKLDSIISINREIAAGLSA